MTNIKLKFAEKKDRKRLALALSHTFNGLFSAICWAVDVQKERQWVFVGNYQQMIRKLPTNALDLTCIRECFCLSGNFLVIFLLPRKEPANLELENLQCRTIRILKLAYRHIKWGLISKLLMSAFSWHHQIPGTLMFNSSFSQFKCVPGEFWAFR